MRGKRLTLAAAMIGAVAAGASAQQQDRRDDQRWFDRYDQPTRERYDDRDRQRFEESRREADDKFEDMIQQMRENGQQVRGRIDRVERVNHSWFNALRVVMTDQNRNQFAVYLPSSSDVGDLNLREGQNVQVSGHRTNINGQDVFIVHGLRYADEQRLFITRNPRVQRVVGIIDDTWTQEVYRDGTTNRMVSLRTDRGDRLTVDLGADALLQRVSLDRGQRIEARGSIIESQGRDLLVADQIRVQNIDNRLSNVNQNEVEASDDDPGDAFEEAGRALERGFKDLFK